MHDYVSCPSCLGTRRLLRHFHFPGQKMLLIIPRNGERRGSNTYVLGPFHCLFKHSRLVFALIRVGSMELITGWAVLPDEVLLYIFGNNQQFIFNRLMQNF